MTRTGRSTATLALAALLGLVLAAGLGWWLAPSTALPAAEPVPVLEVGPLLYSPTVERAWAPAHPSLDDQWLHAELAAAVADLDALCGTDSPSRLACRDRVCAVRLDYWGWYGHHPRHLGDLVLHPSATLRRMAERSGPAAAALFPCAQAENALPGRLIGGYGSEQPVCWVIDLDPASDAALGNGGHGDLCVHLFD